MAQGVVGGNSGTEQRRCFGVSQSLRYGHQRFYGSDHVLLITAVIADARNFQIPAIAEISTPALATGVVLAAVPADTYALSLVPRGNTSTHFIDDACDFMSWNAGILNSRPKPFFREHITVANTTSLNPNAHLSCVGLAGRVRYLRRSCNPAIVRCEKIRSRDRSQPRCAWRRP